MNSIQILLQGVVDYAGLFPPASLNIATAVKNYAEYLKGEHSWMLRKFIISLTRLREFEDAADEYLPKGNPVYPWNLSVISSGNLMADLDELVDFNLFHARDENAGAAIINSIELKASSVEEIYQAMYLIPRTINTYFEIPIDEDPENLINAIANTKARAKVRTGSTHSDQFPTPANLARFILNCARERVQFKATAGLHHSICGRYPLTYEANSESAQMYGFLNVLLATAFARFDLDEQKIQEILIEKSPEAFIFDDGGVQWHRHRLTNDQLKLTRNQIFMGFGSCSFEEPVQELQSLKLL